MAVKGLLKRVRDLEQKRDKVLRQVESIDLFEADVAAGIEAGRYCQHDMPMVLYCIRKWVLRDWTTDKS